MSVGLRPGVELSVLYVGTESQELYGARGIARLSVRPLLNAGEGTLLVPTENRLVAFWLNLPRVRRAAVHTKVGPARGGAVDQYLPSGSVTSRML